VTSRALAPLAVLIAQPFAVAQSQTPERAPDTMAARVLACASCHGAEGEGTSDVYFPRLAGKPAGYLYNQLVAFGDGRRKYPPMDYLLEFLPDAYLKQMAEHFASLRPPFPAPAIPTVSNEILGRGEQLVKNGDPQLGCGDRGDSTGFDIRLRD
jgi:cytochrome c553